MWQLCLNWTRETEIQENQKRKKMKQTTKIDNNNKKKNPEGIIFSGTSKTVQLSTPIDVHNNNTRGNKGGDIKIKNKTMHMASTVHLNMVALC